MAENEFGCTSIADSISIVVNSQPNPISLEAQAGCDGDTLFLFAENLQELEVNWNGPEDFNSNLDTAIIENASFEKGVCFSKIADFMEMAL